MIKITLTNLAPARCGCDVLIVPVVEGDPDRHSQLPAPYGPALKRAVSHGFSGKPQETQMVFLAEGHGPAKMLLVGLGERIKLSPERIRQCGGRALSALRENGAARAALSAAAILDLGFSPSLFAEGALLGQYSFRRYRSNSSRRTVEELRILGAPSRSLSSEISTAVAVASAVHFSRDLVNTPANDMTPSDLARAALSLRGPRMSVKVLGRNEAQKLGMGSYLSVSRGSSEPPKFIVLDYRGSRSAPVVLIGKSVTFDSGGLSLKPSDGMEKMKYDMAGGAAVLGVMKAASALHLKQRIVGILPATENLPGGSATRPGDVVHALDGKTVEVMNTDAEGRLTLADALAYAKRFSPRAVIDIATLTGACAIAFGGEAIAMMGNDRKLMDGVRRAGDATYERVCELPLFEEYREYLRSDVADMKNIGGKVGGLMTSASFLSEFAAGFPWVHLDIAGTAWVEKDRPYIPKGAAGIGVRLLLESLKEIA